MNVNRAIRRVFFTTAALLFVFVVLFAGFILRSPSNPTFSRELSLEEQRAIASAVHNYTLEKAFQALNSGRFGFALERFRTIPRAVVYAQGKQSDGKVWIKVGIPDASEHDRYRLLVRYMMERREDGWAVVNDF